MPLNCHNGVTEDYEKFTTAAVCVYPSRVADAAEALKSMNLPVPIQIAAGTYYLFILFFIIVLIYLCYAVQGQLEAFKIINNIFVFK